MRENLFSEVYYLRRCIQAKLDYYAENSFVKGEYAYDGDNSAGSKSG